MGYGFKKIKDKIKGAVNKLEKAKEDAEKTIKDLWQFIQHKIFVIFWFFEGILHGQEAVSLQAMWWQSATRAVKSKKDWTNILLKRLFSSISKDAVQTSCNPFSLVMRSHSCLDQRGKSPYCVAPNKYRFSKYLLKGNTYPL